MYEGAPLKMEPRAAYVQRKQDERHARPNSPHNQMDVGAMSRDSQDLILKT